MNVGDAAPRLSKRKDSAYRSGRSRGWLKMKNPACAAVTREATPADTEKGTKWDSEISNELEQSDICIITLTRESLNSQWIMFEAGAISRRVERARICPIVFNIEKTDIQGPLSRFQATAFNEHEIHQLLTTINKAAKDAALTEADLDASFKKWWPDLKSEVEAICLTADTVGKCQNRTLSVFRRAGKPTDRDLQSEYDAMILVLELNVNCASAVNLHFEMHANEANMVAAMRAQM